MTITAPAPAETTTTSPLGAAVPATRHRFSPSPLNRRRWQNFRSNRRSLAISSANSETKNRIRKIHSDQ